MPTVLRIRSYRLYFFSNEGVEPPHVHVDRDEHSAKYWLQPVRLGANHGFDARELRRIQEIVEEHEVTCLEKWNAYFD